MPVTIMKWLRDMLEMASPRMCEICGNRLAQCEHTVCIQCYSKFPRLHWRECLYDNSMARELWRKMPIEMTYAYVRHKGHSGVGVLAYQLKYCHNEQVGLWMGRMMGQELVGTDMASCPDLMLPVPLAKSREKTRGYNQSVLIARTLSSAIGVPMRTDVIARSDYTISQTQLNPEERRMNVNDTFVLLKPEAVRGKHILIVDDIVTTGATIMSVVKALLKGGAAKFSVAAWGTAI